MNRARGLAILITLSLLLIPATCANAAGPHSLFDDPMASHEHHTGKSKSSHGDHIVMTQAELELHVLLGHMTQEQADAMPADDEAHGPNEPVVTKDSETNPCQRGPQMRDLPSTMAMAALMTPVTFDELTVLDLPCAAAPVAAAITMPAPTAHTPESPPPQF